MSGFLLDTNCISEAVRVNPEPRVLAWIEAADESLLYLSVLTLGEIRKGLAIDAEVADRWGLFAAGARGQEKGLSVIDGLLAATALHHNLTIVSRNSSDFSSLPVAVLNPWRV